MLELKTKQKLASEAFKLASGLSLVRYRSVTYIPADYETGETSVTPDVDRTIWIPLNRDRIRQLAASQFDTLFASDGELASFNFMVMQNADQVELPVQDLLVRTPGGLKQLTSMGKLEDPSGKFIPNTLVPMLNTEEKDKDRVFGVIEEWLNSTEDAESLLTHLATCLSPGYSAVKYVLFLGEGRNGKGVLLKMLHGLFGQDNVSSVTRQQIAEQSPVVCELNGQLLNLIYDGQAEYLKDSGTEKTLIAGEPAQIRKLYESTPTTVQTNALFVESLNNEPKSKDKSPALQKRLVRFQFSNVYPQDHKFERLMRSEKTLGAFLSLLIDRYVLEDEVAERLAPTAKAIELQLEHMYVNSMGLQFLKYLEEFDALGVDSILGSPLSQMVAKFQSWRLKENDLGTWAEPDVLALFTPLLNSERRSWRDGEKVKKVRVATSLKSEAAAYIDSLKGDHDDADAALLNALVDE